MSFVLSQKHVHEFQQKILLWYETHKRPLPWRETHDPYKILVSEIMSQQTQISRVVPKYEAWIDALPTVEALAQAPVSTVLALWSGLGYNRRALFLQKAAQVIVQTYGGTFPETVDQLEKLPGIGTYTASAVACFAFNAQIPVIDTNIRKVILVHFGAISNNSHSGKRVKRAHPESFVSVGDKSDPGLRQDDEKTYTMTDKEIEETAWILLPAGKAYVWNQALMDYSGAELKAHKIPIPKQSKLLGSDRYYRGQTLKLLISNQELRSMNHVTVHTVLDYFRNLGHPIELERLEKILKGMEKEGFIVRKQDTILLPD